MSCRPSARSSQVSGALTSVWGQRKGITLRKQRNRWRGRMPSRQNHRLWSELYENQGRTGEPSLATLLQLANKFHEEGRGKAAGSFTERMRMEFRDWLRAKGLHWPFTITFEYRLYRHRVITVAMQSPSLFHYRLMGDGSKGFMLVGRVLSIDGVPPVPHNGTFAMTRIVGRFKQEFPALTMSLEAVFAAHRNT